MYEAILNIYLDYDLKQIYQDRYNIRKLIDKIYMDKLIVYYQKIDEFLSKIIFTLLNIYKNDSYLILNIVSFLKSLNFRDFVNDKMIYQIINFHNEITEIREGASILLSFKRKARQEDHRKDYREY